MHSYCELAFQAIKTYLKEGKVLPVPENVPEELKKERSGAFVSLHLKDAVHSLRGCIGTFLPTQENLGQEIIRNAISAATGDPRFWPVSLDELDDLEISVDVLSRPEKATREQLDPKKYGVIVSAKDGRKALLLPDLPEIDTVEKQLKIVCQKGGIDFEKEPFEIERFEVKRFK